MIIDMTLAEFVACQDYYETKENKMVRYIWDSRAVRVPQRSMQTEGVTGYEKWEDYNYLVIVDKVVIDAFNFWDTLVLKVNAGDTLLKYLMDLPEPLKYPTTEELVANKDGYAWKYLSQPEKDIVVDEIRKTGNYEGLTIQVTT
jgi:hypothetical protein